MRRMTRWGGTMMMALSLSACGGEGGELREATERRRQEQGELEKAGGDTATSKDDDGRLPAFVSDSPIAPPAPAPAPAVSDTPPPARTPAGTGQWTASTSEVERGDGPAVVRGLRVARNEGFDRVVIDFGQDAAIPGWKIEYVDRPIRRCGSGDVTRVAGDGWLSIRLRTAQAHDDAGNATVRQREMTFNAMSVLREMEMICDFEGDVEIVLGVASPNPYRVLELQNPSRLVIDVQQ